MTYPLFSPPAPLAAKGHLNWTKAEASQYFSWMIEGIDARIAALLAFLEEDSTDGLELLERAGAKVARLMMSEPFSQNGQLTDSGHALAADVGLMFARTLLLASSAVTWTIQRGPKSDVSYNLPVLVGFAGVPLDPIQLSITQAWGIIQGKKQGDTWRKLFEYWLGKVG